MTEPRLHGPDTIIYASDLDEGSSRYDAIRASPTADALHIKFSIMAAINVVVSISIGLLIFSILRYKKLRERPFNLYVLFVAIPDFIASFCCMLTCIMSAPKSEMFSEAMCGWQSSYVTFMVTSNAWMNAVIVYQVHKLLRYSNIRRRYFQPTARDVCKHAAMVYFYAFGWSILAGFNFKGVPLETHVYSGFVCFPMEQDRASTLFYYLGFIPFILAIPTVYVLGATFHIFWYNLLPKTGRTRAISAFLLRIVFVYLAAWTPFLVIQIVGNFVALNSWIIFAGSAQAHFQGLISSVVIYYTNPELQKSMQSIMCLDCFGEWEDPKSGKTNAITDGETSRWWSRWSTRRSNQSSKRMSAEKAARLQSAIQGNMETAATEAVKDLYSDSKNLGASQFSNKASKAGEDSQVSAALPQTSSDECEDSDPRSMVLEDEEDGDVQEEQASSESDEVV